MATWVAVKIAGTGGVSYINAEQVAHVMTGDGTCHVNFVGAKDNYVIIEGDADKFVTSLGGPAFDVTKA